MIPNPILQSIMENYLFIWGFLGGTSGKEPTYQCRRHKRLGFDPWVGKIPWRRDRLLTPVFLDFPGGSVGKESACNVGDLSSIPGLGRSPGGGHGNHSIILAWRIPMKRGAWWATVHGVAKSQKQLSTE